MITIRPIDATGYSKGIQWCGPAALAMITGQHLRDATQHFTRIRQEPYSELEGVWTEDMVIALNELGYTATPIDLLRRFDDTACGPTLKRFMNSRMPQEISNPLLIVVNTHFVVSHWGLIGDNSTGGKMIPSSQFPRTGRLVKEAYVIQRRT